MNWRQWHHWNYIDSLSQIPIKKGKRVVTLEISTMGNFNFDFFTFRMEE
ncbi:MAG: hypothetical protein HC906_18650 [Bacteroidales bacterium]|nr:hypothetical protein [Bacteroidales bacterium]